ncbi:hypothetical protein [Glaciecola sp. 1036]|uniref:hypothetical protein n=1 Tax=Alteromonadaceae TaxID=72275 RepID=UPI003D03BCE9
MKKVFKYLTLSAAVSTLLACGSADENQDLPSVDEIPEATLNAIPVSILNGYVANAVVWIDFRDNGAIDGSEPFAYSDGEGFVSFNPNTGVNYCESTLAHEQKYCLATGVDAGNLVIKAAKGIEVMSGEPFKSVLTTEVTVAQSKANIQALANLGERPPGDASDWLDNLDASIIKLSAITSVAYFLPEGQSIETVLTRNGYSLPINTTVEEVLSHDYWARLNNDEALSNELFRAELTIGRVVDLIAINLDKATENLDMGVDGLPISTSDYIYQAVVEALIAGELNTSSARQNSNPAVKFQNLLERVRTKIIEVASSVVSNGVSNTVVNNNLSSSITNLAQIPTNHLTSFSSADKIATFQTTTLGIIPNPIAFEESNQATNTLNFIGSLNNVNNGLSARLRQRASVDLESGLASVPNLDLAEIFKQVKDSSDSNPDLNFEQIFEQTDITPAVNIEDPDFSIAGHNLSISGIHDGNEYGQVISYFTGEPGDNSGELIMCVTYRNPQDPTDDIVGERFVGSWSAITQRMFSLVAEGLRVSMKIRNEVDGGQIPVSSQLPSQPKMPGENYGQYRFNLNDDFADWYSDNPSIDQSFGLLVTEEVPATDAACAAQLSL